MDVVNWSKSAKGMYRFEMKEDEQGTWIRALWGHTFANIKKVTTAVKKVTLLRSSDADRRLVVKMLGKKEKERILKRGEHLEDEEMKRIRKRKECLEDEEETISTSDEQDKKEGEGSMRRDFRAA